MTTILMKTLPEVLNDVNPKGEWPVEKMNVSLLTKYNFYEKIHNPVSGYTPILCNIFDIEFTHSFVQDYGISDDYFYTLLWLIAYFRNEFQSLAIQVSDKKKLIVREKEIIRLKRELVAAFGKEIEMQKYEDVVVKINNDKIQTEVKDWVPKFPITEISFTISGLKFKTKLKSLLNSFRADLISDVIRYTSPKPIKTKTKDKSLHTLAIKNLKPFVSFLLSERIIKNKYRGYQVVERLLEYYSFDKGHGKLDSLGFIKNTLKLT